MTTQMPTTNGSSQISSKGQKGQELTTKTIKTPSFSYAHLQVIFSTNIPPLTFNPPSALKSITPAPEVSSKNSLDMLTFRSHVTAALTLFLGLTGSAIDVDVLKIEGNECWVRVPREDLSAVLAALGGWTGKISLDGKVGFNVKASGNWLGSIVSHREASEIWN